MVYTTSQHKKDKKILDFVKEKGGIEKVVDAGEVAHVLASLREPLTGVTKKHLERYSSPEKTRDYLKWLYKRAIKRIDEYDNAVLQAGEFLYNIPFGFQPSARFGDILTALTDCNIHHINDAGNLISIKESSKDQLIAFANNAINLWFDKFCHESEKAYLRGELEDENAISQEALRVMRESE